MFYKQTSRVFAIKFLGLFGGGSLPSQENEKDVPPEQTSTKPASFAHVLPNTGQDASGKLKRAIKSSSKRVASFMIEKGIPGLTICVARRGQIVWHSAFGFCDMENQLECRPEARMRIASISKSMFASMIVAPMMEQNKIDLTSSIYKYITPDEFPKKTHGGKDVDITVEQLLSHTSGICHYDEGRASDLPFRPIGSAGSQKICQADDQYERRGFFQRKTFRSVTHALEPFKDEPLGEPGKYKYTTYGYTLLSAVAERAHQQAASDDKTKKEQIEDHWMRVMRLEWGLNETSLDQDELFMPNRARYYLRTAYNGGLINAPYTDNSVKWAGGGINSTVKDLVKFGNALIESYKGREASKLKRDTVELLWKERHGDYGLGFQLKNLDPRESGGEKRAIYHLGGAVGASSALILYPESEIVVAILTNLGLVNTKPIAFEVANLFAQ